MAANYVRLDFIDRERSIWEYHTVFNPDVDNKYARIQLVGKHFRALGGKIKVFDGGSRLLTPMKTENEVRKFIHSAVA